MKKLLSLVLAMLLVLSCFGVAERAKEGNVYTEGLTIADGDVTLRIMIVQPEGYPTGFEGITQCERFAAETGLNIIWDTIPAAAWEEKKSIIISSNDLPDVIAGGGVSVDEQIEWAKQGLLVELSEYIDDYMPRVCEIFENHPDYRDQLKLPDGSIYAMPHGAMIDFGCRGNLLYVHEDWLKAAGIDYEVREEELYRIMENELTLDEFTDMLYAMKDIAPENCYPLNGGYDKNSLLSELYGMFGQVDNDNHIIVEDDKVIYTVMTDEWRNAVEWVAKLYVDGIIDPEIFTQDNSTFLAKASQEFPMFGFGLVWTAHQFDNDMGEAYDKWILVKPVADNEGNATWYRTYMGVGTGIYLITTACENPVAAARFYDYMQDEDNAMRLSLGEFGTSCEKNEDGTYEMLEYVTDGMPTGLNMMFIGTPESYAKVHFADPTQMTIDVGMEYRAYQPEIPQQFPIVAWNDEEQSTIATLQTDLCSYVAQQQAEWITAGGIEDEQWDAFIEQLKVIGVEEFVEVYQNKLDNI